MVSEKDYYFIMAWVNTYVNRQKIKVIHFNIFSSLSKHTDNISKYLKKNYYIMSV